MVDKNKIIILLILVGVFIGVISFNLRTAKNVNFETQQQIDEFFNLVSLIKQNHQYVLSSFETEKDPFYFKSKLSKIEDTKEVKIFLPSMNLNGIIYNPTAPLAIIDGETYGRGNKVKGAEIVAIFHNRVVLMYKDKEFILKLKE